MSDISVNGLRAHLVRVQGGSAGVLLLPTVAGIDPQARQFCQRIADAGLTALAWDPFSAFDAGLSPDERRSIAFEKLEDSAALGEQSQWVTYMQQELRLDNIGVIGFCLGGRQAFSLCARDTRLKAGVAYHPSIRVPVGPNELDAVALARDVRCPVQVLYPGRDHITSHDTFAALREALESRPAPTITHVYPQAVHGFLDGTRQDDPGNSSATALAWPQTAAFLRACLL